MKLSYRRRFIFAITGYTFVLILVTLAVFWLLIEYIEASDQTKLPSSLKQQIVESIKAGEFAKNTIKNPGYELYSTASELPAEFSEYATNGVHQLKDNSLLIIGQHSHSRELYYLRLGFEQQQSFVEEEFEDILFVILAAILTTCIVVFLVLFMAKRLTLPVIELQERVRNLNINSNQLPLLDRDDEIGQLSNHFSNLIIKMRKYTQREQDFTRFASHELRTPVTIIRGNLDLLTKTLPPSAINLRILKRMEIATQRMSSLIEMFLWLGREDKSQTTFDNESVDNHSLETLIEQIKDTLAEHEKPMISTHFVEFNWQLKPVMLTMVIENLLRNALRHGDGNIKISADQHALTISNHHSLAQCFKEKGIGLQIVQRICDANQWPLTIDAQQASFSVNIRFNDSTEKPINTTNKKQNTGQV
jgi:signal transduction histidine kinase